MLRKRLKQHSSLLLAMGAGIGVLTTAYLSAQAGYQSARVLYTYDPYEDKRKDLKERAKLVWKLYVPPAAAATVTIICVAGVKHVDARKTLAAQTALALSQHAYESYREKVIEEFGDRKDKAILAKVAEDQVKDKPPGNVILNTGDVMCCELWTMRYFSSSMEALFRAVNELNAKMLKHDYATMDDFYYILGLEYTPSSNHSGWSSDKLLELEFSSLLHDGKPYLAFGYNYVKSL